MPKGYRRHFGAIHVSNVRKAELTLLQKFRDAELIKNFMHVMEWEVSLSPASGPYNEPE